MNNYNTSKVGFAERLARGVWISRRLLPVNFVCFLVFFPIISWFHLVLNAYIHAGSMNGMVDILPGFGYFAGLLLWIPPAVFLLLLVFSVLLFGPFLLGLYYVAHGIVVGRHVWVSDLFEAAWWNARQGVVLGSSVLIGMHLLLWNIFGGIHSEVAWVSVLFMLSRWGSAVLVCFVGVALPYVCQIAVTVKQPLWVVVRNGVILARVHFVRGILVLVGVSLYWVVTMVVAPRVGVILLPLVSISLTVLVWVAACWPVVRRRLIEPMSLSDNMQ